MSENDIILKRSFKENNPIPWKNLDHQYRPAINLSLEEMKAYCRFRGKKLLTVQHYDAATFSPERYLWEYQKG